MAVFLYLVDVLSQHRLPRTRRAGEQQWGAGLQTDVPDGVQESAECRPPLDPAGQHIALLLPLVRQPFYDRPVAGGVEVNDPVIVPFISLTRRLDSLRLDAVHQLGWQVSPRGKKEQADLHDARAHGHMYP